MFWLRNVLVYHVRIHHKVGVSTEFNGTYQSLERVITGAHEDEYSNIYVCNKLLLKNVIALEI